MQSIKTEGEKKRELYDRIQIQYNDAKKLVATDLKKQKDGSDKSLLYLDEYLSFSIIEQTYQRNLEMGNELELQLIKAGIYKWLYKGYKYK
jgi:hypothetical protein